MHAKALQILASIVMLPISTFAQGSSSISGEVLIKGQPAPNVKVSLYSTKIGRASTPLSRVLTDSGGKFSFKGIPAGSYLVRPFLPGYAMEEANTPGVSVPLSVGEGASTEGLRVRLIKGGVITGKVMDHDGKPVVRERIEIQRVGPNREQMQSEVGGMAPHETDDRGIYRIYGLQPGNYLVSAGSEIARNQLGSRRVYSRTYYQGKARSQDADIVKVAAGDEVTNIDVKFAEETVSYTISGKVIGISGEPVPGMRLLLTRKTGQMTSAHSGRERSGPDGMFSLSGILPGRYSVSVWFPEPGEDYSDEVGVDVSGGDVSGVELRMRKGSTISGSVIIEGTGDPQIIARLLKADVFAYWATPSREAPKPVRAQLDAQGSFRLIGLRPGTIRLTVSGNQTDLRQLRRRVERDGVVLNDPLRHVDGIDVKGGEHISGVRIVFSYGTGVIRGKLVVTGGELPPDAQVQISLRAFEPSVGQYIPTWTPSVSTSPFQFENLSPGQYEVRLSVIQVAGGVMKGTPIFKSQTATVSNDKTEQVTIELDLSSKPSQ